MPAPTRPQAGWTRLLIPRGTPIRGISPTLFGSRTSNGTLTSSLFRRGGPVLKRSPCCVFSLYCAHAECCPNAEWFDGGTSTSARIESRVWKLPTKVPTKPKQESRRYRREPTGSKSKDLEAKPTQIANQGPRSPPNRASERSTDQKT